MTKPPDWLPQMLSLQGEWESILKLLYSVFEADFRNDHPKFQGKRLQWDRIPDDKYGYEEGFWHLVTRDDKTTGARLPDFRRAERLPWCRPTIDHSDDAMVKVWDYREKGKKIRTYLWLDLWDYCIVMEKRKKVVALITAFYIDGDSKRRNLSRKLANKEN